MAGLVATGATPTAAPFVTARPARPARSPVQLRAHSSPAGSEQASASGAQGSRRDVLLSVAALTLLVAPPAWAEGNVAVQAGLAKYVKRKRMDRVDTYLPPLLQARDQLVRIGRVMLQSPADARQLLRTGSFSGVRQTVRALGEFAAEKEGAADKSRDLVTAFFSAIESLDATLAASARSGAPLDEAAAKAALAETGAAIDRLLETVPEDILGEARRVVQAIGDDAGEEEAAAGPGAGSPEIERLNKLL